MSLLATLNTACCFRLSEDSQVSRRAFAFARHVDESLLEVTRSFRARSRDKGIRFGAIGVVPLPVFGIASRAVGPRSSASDRGTCHQ